MKKKTFSSQISRISHLVTNTLITDETHMHSSDSEKKCLNINKMITVRWNETENKTDFQRMFLSFGSFHSSLSISVFVCIQRISFCTHCSLKCSGHHWIDVNCFCVCVWEKKWNRTLRRCKVPVWFDSMRCKSRIRWIY